jgi:uncharacterized protein YcnI
MSKASGFSILLGAATVLASATAWGHVSMNSPQAGGKSAILLFNVGHGCEGLDAVKVDVSIPAAITALRAMSDPDFGDPTIVKDDAELITNVIWEKNESRASDDIFYQLAIRTTVPDLPFTSLYFPTKVHCMDAEGEEVIDDWAALPGAELLPDGGEPKPSPSIAILPPRFPGWNKWTTSAEVTSLAVFSDAEIVWAGDAAYSSNPATAALIAAEEGVTTLESIPADTEIWVKY